MAATLRDEADMHRLWYNLRNQALFGAGFRDTIIAIDALLSDMVGGRRALLRTRQA